MIKNKEQFITSSIINLLDYSNDKEKLEIIKICFEFIESPKILKKAKEYISHFV